MAAGGSYDTGREIVERIFGWPAPIDLMYEFVGGIKGQKGKMSGGSKGNVILLSDLYEVLEPGGWYASSTQRRGPTRSSR